MTTLRLANTPKELIKQLGTLGLSVRKDTGLGHYKVYDPDTNAWLFNVSNSPSDVNWHHNIKRHLRRLGLLDVVITKKTKKTGGIDLGALKLAQEKARAAGAHIPTLEDTEDDVEFFKRIKTGSGGYSTIAQEGAIDNMVAKADSSRLHSTRARFGEVPRSSW